MKKKPAHTRKPALKEKPQCGRPPEYQPAYPQQAYRHCLLGATIKELAELFEVAEGTVYRWMNEHPAFREAIKRGRAEADGRVAFALFRKATGFVIPEEKIFCSDGKVVRAKGRKYYPPDAISQIFWLKNRKPEQWRDKPVAEAGDDRLNEVLDLIRNGPTSTTEDGDEPAA